jgi:hypothetical protein
MLQKALFSMSTSASGVHIIESIANTNTSWFREVLLNENLDKPQAASI